MPHHEKRKKAIKNNARLSCVFVKADTLVQQRPADMRYDSICYSTISFFPNTAWSAIWVRGGQSSALFLIPAIQGSQSLEQLTIEREIVEVGEREAVKEGAKRRKGKQLIVLSAVMWLDQFGAGN